MGNPHQPQPDVPREHWGDMRGDEDNPGNLWEESQEKLPQQTFVPPEVQVAQQGLLQHAQQEQSDEHMAAAMQEEPEESTAASKEESPDRAAGTQTMAQMLAELDTWQKRYSC